MGVIEWDFSLPVVVTATLQLDGRGLGGRLGGLRLQSEVRARRQES